MDRKKRVLFSTHMALMISALLSAVLLVTLMLSTPYVMSWFKNKLEVPQPARISNFVTQVEYYNADSAVWTDLDAGAPIVLSPDAISSLKIRVTYQGFSQAYVRAKVFGSFKNKHTGTFLPQGEDLWTLGTNSKWVSSEGWLYYPEVLGSIGTSSSDTKILEEFTVSVNTASLDDASDHQEYLSEVYILVDAVQPDRWQAHWGISTLPFTVSQG
ncbi:MAG: hypothetical protein IJD01_07865 [Clostridia bacterium]|nr:hypothetical protein [Clostridia bacterium]